MPVDAYSLFGGRQQRRPIVTRTVQRIGQQPQGPLTSTLPQRMGQAQAGPAVTPIGNPFAVATVSPNDPRVVNRRLGRTRQYGDYTGAGTPIYGGGYYTTHDSPGYLNDSENAAVAQERMYDAAAGSGPYDSPAAAARFRSLGAAQPQQAPIVVRDPNAGPFTGQAGRVQARNAAGGHMAYRDTQGTPNALNLQYAARAAAKRDALRAGRRDRAIQRYGLDHLVPSGGGYGNEQARAAIAAREAASAQQEGVPAEEAAGPLNRAAGGGLIGGAMFGPAGMVPGVVAPFIPDMANALNGPFARGAAKSIGDAAEASLLPAMSGAIGNVAGTALFPGGLGSGIGTLAGLLPWLFNGSRPGPLDPKSRAKSKGKAKQKRTRSYLSGAMM